MPPHRDVADSQAQPHAVTGVSCIPLQQKLNMRIHTWLLLGPICDTGRLMFWWRELDRKEATCLLDGRHVQVTLLALWEAEVCNLTRLTRAPKASW